LRHPGPVAAGSDTAAQRLAPFPELGWKRAFGKKPLFHRPDHFMVTGRQLVSRCLLFVH